MRRQRAASWIGLSLVLALLPACAGKLNRSALNPSSVFEMVPEDLGLDYEAIAVPVDGAELTALLAPAPGSREAVVVCPGNTGNMGLYLPLARALVDAGYHAVLFDHRGFGLSGGEPDLGSLLPDARAVVAAVRARPEVERVALFGVSLGSVVALGVAAQDPEHVEALVIEGVFVPKQALQELVGSFAATLAGPFVVPSGWKVERNARRLAQPILFLHGSQDGITELQPATRVFTAAREAGAPRAFWIADGAGHSPGLAGHYGDEYVAHVQRFLDAVLRGEGQAPAAAASWQLVVNGEGPAIEVELELRAERGEGVRRPVELAVLYAAGDPEFHRVWCGAGPAARLRLPVREEPRLVCAALPACGIEERGGTWVRDDPFQRDAAAWEGDEVEVYEALGHGSLLHIAGATILFRMEDPPAGDELLTRCRETEARLTARLAVPVHPRVRPLYAPLWDALAKRYDELERPVDALRAWEGYLALVPEEPAAFARFGDASWSFGWPLGRVAAILERMAELSVPLGSAGLRAPAGELRARAAAWRARELERSRFLRDWTAARRPPSEL